VHLANFALGQCIYDQGDQGVVAAKVIERVFAFAETSGRADEQTSHPTQSYWPAFEQVLRPMMRIAALFKDPGFGESFTYHR
jgi:hypothetical protein